jgi:hypothetical protein
MTRVTIVSGNRADLADLVASGELWAEDNEINRPQVEAIWANGGSATLFAAKDLAAVIGDVELHHPDWSELRALRH